MSFDRLAPCYRSMEFVLAGRLLQHCRLTFLSEAARAQHALLLGEGPGRFLIELVRANPSINVTCLDSSARMLAISRNQLRRVGLPEQRIRFICSDWEDYPDEAHAFDLIATHFFLDCFSPEMLARLICRIAAVSTGNAAWVVSDFRLPDAGWRRWRARLILAAAYWFFRKTTHLSVSRIAPVDPLLEHHGFKLKKRRLFSHGLLHADWWLREPQTSND